MKLSEYVKRTKTVFAAIFIIFLLLIFIAPLTLPSGSIDDLDGSVGTIDNMSTISQMNPFAAVAYILGDMNCHQMTLNSYYINGNEMPVCVRDTGIFLGLAAGMLISLIFSPKFKWAALIILILPIIIDGGAQMISDYVSFNELRLVTGILGGLGASYLLGHIIEMSVRKDEGAGTKS